MNLFAFDATPLATALLNGLWQGLLLAAVVSGVLYLLGKHRPLNAATRYVAYTVLLLVLVSLPLAPQVQKTLAPEPMPAATATPLAQPVPASDLAAKPVPRPGPERAEAVPLEAQPPTAFSEPPRPTWQLPATLTQGMTWAAGAWLLIAGILLFRVGRSVRAVQRIRQAGRPLPPRYQEQLAGWRRRYRVRRRVQLLGTEALETPVAAGYARPAILLPVSLLDVLTEAELEQVVLHELAHLHRCDDWTNLFQKIAQAVFFFHPAVHLVARAMDRTREVACDDWVVARTQQPHAYASCLTRLVELDVQQRGRLLAPGMAAKKSHLFARVQRLLAQGRTATTRLSKANLMLAGLLLVAAYLLLARVAPGFAPPTSEAPMPIAVAELPIENRHIAPIPVLDLTQTNEASLAMRSATARPATPDLGTASAAAPAEPPSDPSAALAGLAPLPLAQPERQSLPATAPPLLSNDGLVRSDLSAASWKRVLRAASRLASSKEQGLFLRESAPRLPANAEVFGAYIASASTIVSPSERRRALTALIDHQRLGAATLELLIKASRDLASSSDKAHVLQRIAGVLPNEAALHDAYRRAADTLPSPSDYRRVMNALR